MVGVTPIEAPLLASAGENHGARHGITSVKKVVATAMGMIAVGTVCFQAGQQRAKFADRAVADKEALLGQMVSVPGAMAPTSLAIVPYSTSCYGFTGGTCAVQGCNENRSASCVQAKCVCLNGCTGVDGKCHAHNYEKVAGPFTLSNVNWPSQQLYMQELSLFDQLKVGRDFAMDGTNEFNLLKLPGTMNGKKQYFLSSNKWPSWLVAISSTTGTSFTPFGAFAYNIYHTVMPWNPQGLVLTLCSMNKFGYENTVMISSGGVLGEHHLFVHGGSWLVYATTVVEDPGKGGYWKPSVPIEGLDEC